jgi:hypothetical protein
MLNVLYENSLQIVGYGLFLAVPIYVLAFHFQDKRLWIGCGIVTGLIALALIVEWSVQTPKEEVEQTVRTLANLVENNNVQSLLRMISKTKPEIVSRARHEMPRYDFDLCKLLVFHQIKIDENNPKRATAEFRVFVNVETRGYSGNALRDVFLNFEKESDGRWRVVDYTHYSPGTRENRPNNRP